MNYGGVVFVNIYNARVVDLWGANLLKKWKHVEWYKFIVLFVFIILWSKRRNYWFLKIFECHCQKRTNFKNRTPTPLPWKKKTYKNHNTHTVKAWFRKKAKKNSIQGNFINYIFFRRDYLTITTTTWYITMLDTANENYNLPLHSA